MWKEIGFSVNIPQGAVPIGKLVKVAVCPHQSSPASLPPNLELASPAYVIAILPEIAFLKPVTISINAFNGKMSTAVNFVSTQKTTQGHYEDPQPSEASLRVLQGGDFNPSVGVGTITLDCLPTVIAIACVLTNVSNRIFNVI